MKNRDNLRPPLRIRREAAELLLDQEAGTLEGFDYVPERDREVLVAALHAGWREVRRINARAAVDVMISGRGRRAAE